MLTLEYNVAKTVRPSAGIFVAVVERVVKIGDE